MVVAVAIVRVVQMTVHQVIDMVAMRHGLMGATWPVYMTCGVAVALGGGRRAAITVEDIHRKAVLVDVITTTTGLCLQS